jgi:biofilm PGA synthesis N-glycosyltransferase PgaC
MNSSMHLIQEIWSVVFSIVLVGYFLLLLILTISWLYMKTKSSSAIPVVRVSLILPVRNEAANIVACLQSLSEQDYPSDLLQIMVVDDSSTDATTKLVDMFIKANVQMDIKLLRLQEEPGVKAHKKRAITEGINHSDGELIITTDGDCTAGPEWIRTTALFYQEKRPALIIGPVAFHNEKNLFGKMQSLEHAGLMVVSGASCRLQSPLLCSGANLAYSRHVFKEVNGYHGDNEPSGDDIMLLHKVQAIYPAGIQFLKCSEAIVWTAPQSTVTAFLEQRRRWSSKFKSYKHSLTAKIAVLIFLCNAFILIGALTCLFYPGFVRLYLILAAGKLIIDFLFLFLGISFLHRKVLLWVYIPEQFVYSFYVVLSGCLGLKKGYSWKERRV